MIIRKQQHAGQQRQPSQSRSIPVQSAEQAWPTRDTERIDLIYDSATQQAVDAAGKPQRLSVDRKQARYAFEGGHRSVGVIYLIQIAQLKLSKNQIRVAIWLPSLARRGNLVAVTGAQAEHTLGIERHLFSRIMSKMVEMDVLRREARSLWMMNPRYAWNGAAVEHKAAIEDWDRRGRMLVEIRSGEELQKMVDDDAALEPRT